MASQVPVPIKCSAPGCIFETPADLPDFPTVLQVLQIHTQAAHAISMTLPESPKVVEKHLCIREETQKTTIEAANQEWASYPVDHLTSTRTRVRLQEVEQELKEVKISKAMLTKRRENEISSYKMKAFNSKQELLRKLVEENRDADVAFLMDCTGSMAAYINEAKKQIKWIVSEITKQHDNKLRVAFVGYRDHWDGPLRIESLNFTENTEEFTQFVSRISASGGDDAPEDVLGGLEAATNLTWSSASRVIFHIGDSPQHGERFHNYGPGQDSYFTVEPRGLTAEDVFDNMKQIGIKYFFGKVNNTTDKMFKVFQSIGGEDMVNEVDMNNPNMFKYKTLESISTTIAKTLSETVLKVVEKDTEVKRKSLKKFSLKNTMPRDADLEPQKKVYWLTCILEITDVKNIKEQIMNVDHKWSDKMLKKAKQPFAEGVQRISYHGRKMNYAENGVDDNIVLKEFKHLGTGRDRREDYVEIMETQCVASYMAMEFNKVAPPGSKNIAFLEVSVVEIREDDGTPKYFNVEKLLPDYSNFKKWNNNCGAVNLNDHLIQAFSHWTFDITDGFMVVVDLQGVERPEEYGLTDPCINCLVPLFGSTNMGKAGIELFFQSHICNNICTEMGLKEITFFKKLKKQFLG